MLMTDRFTGKIESSQKKISIIIPGSSDLFGMSIRFLLQDVKDIEIIMTESDCRQLSNSLEPGIRGIIVTQYSWLEQSSANDIKGLLEASPDIKVLMYLKPKEFVRASSLFQFGIQGFFTDSITREEFLDCLTELSRGKSFFSQEIIPVLLAKEPEKGRGLDLNITARENEILLFIRQGFTNKEIASKLFLSPRTIEGHRANLILKFGVRNTAELISEVRNLLELA